MTSKDTDCLDMNYSQHRYSQTNLQLFNQLRSEGHQREDLENILQCYKLTMELFSGQFRPSGKTFIAHLVGTASILCQHGASTNVIGAGLLHAAYTHGHFRKFRGRGVSASKRAYVRQVVGEDIEDYLARYTSLRWTTETIPEIYQQLDQLEFRERSTLLIRLANELEEYLDLGIYYCGSEKEEVYAHHNHSLAVSMAKSLGYPQLALELNEIVQNSESKLVWLELRNPTGNSYSGSLSNHHFLSVNSIVNTAKSLKQQLQKRISSSSSM